MLFRSLCSLPLLATVLCSTALYTEGFSVESPGVAAAVKDTSDANSKEHAVVVGGGPVGLASALMLANAPHNYDVTIFESSSKETIYNYNPGLAYLYNINCHGQEYTKGCCTNLKIHEKLVQRVIPSQDVQFLIVPSDPEEPISRPASRQGSTVSYWIARHEMVTLLQEIVQEHNDQKGNRSGTIDFCSGVQCESVGITHHAAGDLASSFSVMARDDSGEQFETMAKLVVGADGINSKVRQSLAETSGKFRIKKWASPSTGLQLKALQAPVHFPIQDVNGTMTEAKSYNAIAIRGVKDGPSDYLSLGGLPMQNSADVRPLNAITRSNHILRSMKTGDEVQTFFEKNFPRMGFQKKAQGGIVPDEEWERFATAEGTTFPHCQYSPGLQVSATDGESGVVLLGDAAHAFPPDSGQGINAGLQDVAQLDKILKRSKGNLGSALKEYENIRSPETRGLIRIARFAAPYQYNQPLRIDRFLKKLWLANVVMRLFLNKVTLGIFPKQVSMTMNDGDKTYKQSMKQADIATAVLTSAFASLLLKCFLPVIMRRAVGV